MTRTITHVLSRHGAIETQSSDKWIRDGWNMAHHEGEAAFQSIELKHQADVQSQQVRIAGLRAYGQVLFERRQALQERLLATGFDPAEHLRALAQGPLDLIWSSGLLLLHAALALFVLLDFGPLWL